MRKLLMIPFAVMVCMLSGDAALAQSVELKAGMKITSSVKVRRAVYTLNGTDSLNRPVIEISGNNIVVDFDNAELRGSLDKQLPNEYYGLAILVKDGAHITIRNLKARGYKVALLARNVQHLRVEGCDFSYNYRQRLNSSQEKEDISDWMSYHQNEKDEWLRYGAAIYLRDCNNASIVLNTVTGGQCALMMTNCNFGLVINNNFSFNSAIGIGMYRSSGNRIMYNKLDWNVRGHSEGIYNRGQDSAAMLVFEQCNDNIFLYNSATHSGDGFFLWAGQSTMDSGKGGCNGNYLYGNDFSHAPTNGIEVTFSSNIIVNNRVEECDHGIWGGYSFNTTISRNRFAGNRIAIAIEHGQDNAIYGNEFRGNKESIRLWARKEQPKDWGYARERDTRSRHYSIQANAFTGDSIVYNITNTAPVRLTGNKKLRNKTVYKLDSITAAAIDTAEENALLDAIAGHAVAGEQIHTENVMLQDDDLRGRRYILMTEWGPYDFRYPLLWRTNPLDTSGLLQFDLLAPVGGGRWRVVSTKGVEGLSKQSGGFNDALTARKIPGFKGEILIELEYIGTQITTQFGEAIAAGQPVRFAFRDARVPMHWNMKWFAFDSATNPVKDPRQLAKLLREKPFMTRQVRDLNFAWWGGVAGQAGEKITQFISVAESSVSVEPGEYELAVTWDDAVRVILDGKIVLNEWDPSLYKFDEAPNQRLKLRLGGKHTFKVEHAELGGFATIAFKLKRL